MAEYEFEFTVHKDGKEVGVVSGTTTEEVWFHEDGFHMQDQLTSFGIKLASVRRLHMTPFPWA